MTEPTSSTAERDTAMERAHSSPAHHLGLMALALALSVLLWFVLHLHVLPRRDRSPSPVPAAQGTA